MEDSVAQENNSQYTIADYVAELLGIKTDQVNILYGSCNEEERTIIKEYLIADYDEPKPNVQEIINKYLNNESN